MIKLEGFLPDADPTTPGVMTDCANIIPTKRGYAGGPSDTEAVAGLGALSAACRGSAVLTSTSGTRRHFAGTQTKLYELSGASWADVSRTANYVGSSESRWLFEQFGNVALASNDVEKIQWSSSGVFQDVTAAPISPIMFATDNFVFALNTNHTATGDRPDGWMCSAYQDYSSWTANVSTQATSGRLIGNGGALTAGLALGQYAVAYKADSIFLGSYAGAPIVWQWDRIPGETGCLGPEAVCDIGGAHFFVGEEDCYIFDGTRPRPVGAGAVAEWFTSQRSAVLKQRTIARHDRRRNLVWVFFASTNAAALDSALVYHLLSGKWGRADRAIEAAFSFVSPGVTFDGLSAIGATYDSLPDTPYDSPFWQLGAAGFGVFDASHRLRLLSGLSVGGSFTTGDVGNDGRMSMLRQSRLRFLGEPASATAQGMSRATAGATLVPGLVGGLAEGKFDHRQSGRFHRVSYNMTGPFEVAAARFDLVSQGQR